jgi:hypothetical protein
MCLITLAIQPACKKTGALPDPPVPMTDEDHPTPMGTTPSEPIGFHGKLRVTGEIGQYAAEGPPLRLRVTGELSAPPNGQWTVTSLSVTPPELAARWANNNEKKKPLQWPFSSVPALRTPEGLTRYLSRPLSGGSCRLEKPANTQVKIYSSKQDGGQNVHYRSSPAHSNQRNEVSGHLQINADGKLQKASIRLRRWTRFEEHDCRLVQIESIRIEAL